MENKDKHLVDPKKWVHSHVIKLKDKPNRGGVFIHLEGLFGFKPDFIAITKVAGRNNAFVVSAEMPETMIEERKKIEEKLMLKSKPKKVDGKKE